MCDWISVKDRLPERCNLENDDWIISDVVFAWFVPYIPNGRSSIVKAYYVHTLRVWQIMSDVYIGRRGYKITHWMPIPKPPEDNE